MIRDVFKKSKGGYFAEFGDAQLETFAFFIFYALFTMTSDTQGTSTLLSRPYLMFLFSPSCQLKKFFPFCVAALYSRCHCLFNNKSTAIHLQIFFKILCKKTKQFLQYKQPKKYSFQIRLIRPTTRSYAYIYYHT